MSWYARQPDGSVLLFVRAKPRASRSRVVGIAADGASLEIAVAAPPVDGEANAALVEFLAKALGVRKSSVSLARGDAARHKVFRIEDVTDEELHRFAGT